jgi:acetylornithine deacetylase/succinyl-diaminopimelate desuccinylase-like protein
MNTIRIGRLDLKCRGIPPATAQAAMGELSSALAQQLTRRDEPQNDGPARPHPTTIRLSGNTTPATLANAVAARVTATVHARLASGSKPTKES